MSITVDQLLRKRAHREPSGHSSRFFLFSLVFHATVVGAVWIVPQLFAKPPEKFDSIAVVVVPPQVLGVEEPPPPPPPKPRQKRPEPPPPEPAPQVPPPKLPEPKPVEADVPVLVDKKKPVEKKPTPPPPPPPKRQTKPVIEPPPKRVGSPFGKSLGVSTNKATLGVEDPNFTYGYYLDRIVAAISGNWVRPPLGDLKAKIHFRIRRDGTIDDLRLVESSTSRDFDAAALRAVQSSSPLPPLPKGYKRDDLGINLIVK